jgi:hypothetical protein
MLSLARAMNRTWSVTARNACGKLIGLARTLDDGAYTSASGMSWSSPSTSVRLNSTSDTRR